jgi:hypothetical protein|tara:strand:- start:136 stop:579 length:444 start_codon:yes stop_codon:yes gene_type:complete
MSKLQRDQFNQKYGMPDEIKIMGTVPTNISSLVNQMVLEQNTENAKKIVDTINNILKTQITDISADQFPEPFQSDAKMNNDFVNPTGVFYLVTLGDAKVRMNKKDFNLPLHKIVFVNERVPYIILSQSTNKLIMLSARFVWDKINHG